MTRVLRGTPQSDGIARLRLMLSPARAVPRDPLDAPLAAQQQRNRPFSYLSLDLRYVKGVTDHCLDIVHRIIDGIGARIRRVL